MDASSPPATGGPERRLAAEVISLIQAHVDTPVDADRLALRLGTDAAHVAATVFDVTGFSLEDLRFTLLAEREAVAQGAVVLQPDPPRSGADMATNDVPPGLVPSPAIEQIGPLQGHTVALDTLGPLAVTRSLWSLVRDGEPVAPYSVGVLTRAWGRGDDRVAIRCVRLTDPSSAAPDVPFRDAVEAWSHSTAWYASFPFSGSVARIEEACTWVAARWVPNAGLRLGYGPLLALVEGVPDWRGRVRASLHVAVADLPRAGGR